MKFVIIGGTNKAGTTSLYAYLSDHPSIVSSKIKQTDFFISDNWNTLENYYSFFPNQTAGKINLEASPDYLYEEKAAERIHTLTQNHEVHLIFLLRNPVDRFLSWFKYAKQLFLIPEECSLQEFIDQNVANKNSENEALKALETGKYVHYLKPFFEKFEKSAIQIVFTEDLKNEPLEVMNQIAERLKIDQSVFLDHDFVVHNKSVKSKNKYLRSIYTFLRNIILPIAKKEGIFSQIIVFIGKKISAVYRYVNTKDIAVQKTVNDSTHDFLANYYKASNRQLADLMEQELPWTKE